MRARPLSVKCLSVWPAMLLVGLFAACGGGSGQQGGPATPVGSTPAAGAGNAAGSTVGNTGRNGGMSGGTSTATRTTTSGALPAPTSTADVAGQKLTPAPTRPAVLSSIRAADNGTYDRVVFALDGPIGGYVVRYVDTLTMDPSDQPVPHAGDTALQVTMQEATLDTTHLVGPTETPRTYRGQARLKPGLKSVKEIVQAGDFEATLTYGIGIDGGRKPFRVLLLGHPTRLVVDVAH